MAVSKKKAAPKSKAKAVKPDAESAGFYCYIGPSIRGLIQSGTVYMGTREDALKAAAAAIERRPLIRTLIVPGETLAADRIKVKTPGSALFVNYRRVAQGK